MRNEGVKEEFGDRPMGGKATSRSQFVAMASYRWRKSGEELKGAIDRLRSGSSGVVVTT